VAIYLGWQGATWYRRRVNPYYAARQLEKTLPDAKESVVTWLDLHDYPLPPVFRNALTARAARDLNQADLDRAFSVRRNWRLAGALGVLLLPILFLLVTRPVQALSVLGRTFLPLEDVEVPRATRLVLVAPKTGNCFVAERQPVPFLVRVEGHNPAE